MEEDCLSTVIVVFMSMLSYLIFFISLACIDF